MNLIANTWRQLVQRRLWPVAVLLVAALVAVPFVLAKQPAPVVPAPPPAAEEPTAAEAAATGDPLVSLAEEGDRQRRRRVLGARKDPFEPAPPRKAKKSNEPQPAEPPAEPASPPSGPTDGGAPSVPGFELPPIEPPAEPKKNYPPDALIVRFGDPASELQRQTVAKLEALPASTEPDSQPVLVYVGLTKDGKAAKFMVDALAEATGDGECKPHPSNCETIVLRKGETEFFDILDEAGAVVAQYQLDLVDIKTSKKASASKARKSVARVSKLDSGL